MRMTAFTAMELADVRYAPWWGVLLVLFVVIGLWSALARLWPELLPGSPVARNLFLGVRLQSPSGEASSGHLLALDPRRATLVANRPYAKGDTVLLNLSALPDYPDSAAPLTATVTGARCLSGQPQTFIVNVRFTALSPTSRTPLVQYIEQLSGHGRLSHA